MASQGGYVGVPGAIEVEEIDWRALETAWNCLIPHDARAEIEKALEHFVTFHHTYADAPSEREWHDSVRKIEKSLKKTVSIRDKLKNFDKVVDRMDDRLCSGLSERLHRQMGDLELLAEDIDAHLGPRPDPPSGPRPDAGLFRGFVNQLWEISVKYELPRGSLSECAASPFEQALHCLAPQGATIETTINKFRNARRHMKLSGL